MRTKEEANDYRYFPEPDLPPLLLTQEFIAQVAIPQRLPHQAFSELCANGVSAADARTLIADQRLVGLYFALLAQLPATDEARKWAANVICGELSRALNDGEADLAALKFSPAQLGKVYALQTAQTISSTAARTVLAELFLSGKEPDAIVAEKGLAQVSDSGALSAVVEAVLQKSPGEVEKYKAGKKNLLGFFVGAAMKELKGKGNPGELNKLFKAKLGD